MPLLTRTFIKTALVYLTLALLLGILLTLRVSNSLFPVYTALGHKLRFFRRWKAQFVTVGII